MHCLLLQYISTAMGHLQVKKCLRTHKKDAYNCVVVSEISFITVYNDARRHV
jgi:hypothetical protein